MIVCSCNRLSDGDVKGCLGPGPDCPRTPAQVYRCLGCSPNCGACARTIRSLMTQAVVAAAQACCPLGAVGACTLHLDHADLLDEPATSPAAVPQPA